MKEILAVDKPGLHRHRRSKLFSKFHGLLFSTHSSWCIELNLNCKILFPTSTILRSEPIFKADLNVLLNACWFCYLSASNLPNRLREHSSSRSGVLFVDITISSSSSFMSCSLFRLSTMACSVLILSDRIE